ncbi:MAG: hypothetical protein K2L45_05220 [Muribaculaceae bacterium]|nr:hypothetical protein [Muribaculaceae bacterium]
MKFPKIESIRKAILKAIEVNDTEAAQELIELWASKIKLESEECLIFYYTKLQVLLKCYDQTKDANARVKYLHDAIETGNKLFALNDMAGFPMDDEVQIMWYTLVDLSAQFVAYYLEEAYDENYECDDCVESDFDNSCGILSEAIWARIGKVNFPKFKA